MKDEDKDEDKDKDNNDVHNDDDDDDDDDDDNIAATATIAMTTMGTLTLAMAADAAPATGASVKFPSFEAWADEHGRVYEDAAERAVRRSAYEATLERFRKRHAEEGRNGARYAPDWSSDRTLEELQAQGCAVIGDALPEEAVTRSADSFTERELREARASPSIDWRQHGAVAPVQQQHPLALAGHFPWWPWRRA